MAEARRVTDFPFAVQEDEQLRIPMPDGRTLAARLWLPEGGGNSPLPAVLEYIPYRRRDMTRPRDSRMHPYFAGHGYAALRVDLRGSGDSEGLLTDEYTETELDDGCHVLQWLEEQPWCNGRVGMIGISWGGFNGLQIAARQPPQLQAVIAVCASDDRYADDVHYMGGCLLGDNLSWASTMFAYNSLPPDPHSVGERWREIWLERLEANEPWVIYWLRHPHRNEYWKHASICEDWDAVKCPIMAVSGWADGYSNAVFRLMEKLKAPRQGLIGPWSHKYPHEGEPGPAIGFLQKALRWWDHWLKDRDTGMEREGMLRAWVQNSVPPFTRYARRPGRWCCEASWPSPNVRELSYQLDSGGRLSPGNDVDGRDQPLELQSPLSVGLFAGKWCSYAATPDLPHDQREEDGGALTFDTQPLDEPMDILGRPVLKVALNSNQPVAMLAARLSDVAPDGQATRVSYGVLNLCQRNSREHPEVLEPHQEYRVQVLLNGCAQNIPAGHRIRLSLSTSYFPLAWPPPAPVRLCIFPARSRFLVPHYRGTGDHGEPPPAEAITAAGIEQHRLTEAHHNWWVKRDLENDISTLEVINDEGWMRLPGVELDTKRRTLEWYSYERDDFSSPRGETLCEWGLRRDEWHIETVTHTIMSCDAENFYIHARLDAYEGPVRIFSRNWNEAIPRRMV